MIATDILYKIYNHLHLEQVLELNLPDKYWKSRALQLYGIKIDNLYMSYKEKYIQVSGFQFSGAEVCKESELHIPKEKCALLSIKSGNMKLLKYFLETEDTINLISENLFLGFNNIDALNIIRPNRKYFMINMNNDIKPETYQWCLDNIPIRPLNYEGRIFVELIPYQIFKLLDLEKIGVKSDMVQYAASTMDLKTYKKYYKIIDTYDPCEFSPYISDDPQLLGGNRAIAGVAIVFGAVKILRDINWDNFIGDVMIRYPPMVNEHRAIETYEYLISLKISGIKGIEIFIEYWHWRIFKSSSGIKIPSDSKLYKLLCNWVEDYGNSQLTEKWMDYFPEPSFPNIYIHPELTDALVRNIGKGDDCAFELFNLYSPEVYLEIFHKLDITTMIVYVPTADILVKVFPKIKELVSSGSEDEIDLNGLEPEFMEPKLYWKKENLSEKLLLP